MPSIQKLSQLIVLLWQNKNKRKKVFVVLNNRITVKPVVLFVFAVSLTCTNLLLAPAFLCLSVSACCLADVRGMGVAHSRDRTLYMESRSMRGLCQSVGPAAAVSTTTRVTAVVVAASRHCSSSRTSAPRVARPGVVAAAGPCPARTPSTRRRRAAATQPTPRLATPASTWKRILTRSPTRTGPASTHPTTTPHARPPGRTRGQSLTRRTSTTPRRRPISSTMGGAS